MHLRKALLAYFREARKLCHDAPSPAFNNESAGLPGKVKPSLIEWLKRTNHPVLLGLLSNNLPVLVVKQLLDLHRPQVVDTSAELAVVMEQPQPPLELNNGVVRRPPQDRLQDPAGIRERTRGTRPRGVAEVVRVTRRVAEVVRPVLLVHPCGLEKALVVVVGQDLLSRRGVQDLNLLHLALELEHVVGQLAHLGAEGIDPLTTRLFGPGPALVKNVVAFLVALQLPTPQPAEIQIRTPVVVHKRGGVDAEAPLDRLGLGLERSLGLVPDGDADAEDALLVARGEVQVVLPVLGGGVGGPELLGHPGDVLGLQDHAVVCHLRGVAVEAVEAEDVVVGHVVLVAIVVEFDVSLAVMGRVDVDLVIEDVG